LWPLPNLLITFSKYIQMSNRKSSVQPKQKSGNAAKPIVSRCSFWQILFPLLGALADIDAEDDLKDIQANNYRLANDPVAYAEFIKNIG